LKSVLIAYAVCATVAGGYLAVRWLRAWKRLGMTIVSRAAAAGGAVSLMLATVMYGISWPVSLTKLLRLSRGATITVANVLHNSWAHLYLGGAVLEPSPGTEEILRRLNAD